MHHTLTWWAFFQRRELAVKLLNRSQEQGGDYYQVSTHRYLPPYSPHLTPARISPGNGLPETSNEALVNSLTPPPTELNLRYHFIIYVCLYM